MNNRSNGKSRLTLSLCFVCGLVCATNADVIKVFLQGGQSNSDGRALTNSLPARLLQPQPDIPIYYYLTGGPANIDGSLGTLTTLRPALSALGGGTTFGPELTFGRTLADYYALSNAVPTDSVTVALIKYAHGGTSLATQWTANGNSTANGDGPDYVIFQKVVAAGLSRLATAYPQATLELDGMFWVHGESDIDAGASAAAAYGTNLVRFIHDVRLTFGSYPPYGTNFPFFLSRISANQTVYSTPSDPDYPNYLLLRMQQAYAVANLTNVYMLDTDGAQFSMLTPYSSPGLHFDTAGQMALGTAFANLVRTSLPRPSLGALEQESVGWRVSFTGVSGTRHHIEWSPAANSPWTTVTNIVMNPSGHTNYSDAVPRGDSGLYRVSRP